MEAKFTLAGGSMDDVRAGLRKEMIRLGQPPEMVDEMVDLSIHATDQAFSTMTRIMMSASNPLMVITISGLASAMLATKLATLRESTADLAKTLNAKNFNLEDD